MVVLPTASSWSVMLRTSGGSSAISAMPPALSVIGPKASSATTTPVIDSIVVAAMAMLYRPPMLSGASWNAPQMLAQTAMTGRAVAFIEMPRPAMMLVASPVSEASAMVLTGLKSVPV